MQISLFSANGSSVFNRYESASAGDCQTEIDISHLPTGAYFVRMEAGAAAWVEKIIKK
ncbi:MAG: T9SS type A sorting domain-containing protein [Ignavibacteria bacterium]|nr:T9SS type A sorting domain-containing protein [Ignavibacteria bacterium]